MLKAEIEDELDLGEWWVGALPTPIPVTITLAPKLKFASAVEFAGKFTLALPFQLVRDQNGWDPRFAPNISGDAHLVDAAPAAEVTLSSTFSLVPEFGFSVGPVDGALRRSGRLARHQGGGQLRQLRLLSGICVYVSVQ